MCLDPNCEARTGLHYMWNAQQYLSNAQKELVSIHHERCRVNEEHWDIFRLPIVLPAHDVSRECRSRYYRALGLATRTHHLEQRERLEESMKSQPSQPNRRWDHKGSPESAAEQTTRKLSSLCLHLLVA
ncbi:hypothetical protein CABS01_16917 [Colletotrichum abscissum]|uniref:uncharacterized protein n=1 Tax=Colletotrichum abscissum TaxID=1671311 RepID=UPI0027D75865|nr:uncharacterized protein CABS01_16917 [Colletotrichum abscissum]KAK1504341.1 hypothetical protein CABS01_16917 [Colletotrichum abscissum]